jgi:serine/threonine protein kinase
VNDKLEACLCDFGLVTFAEQQTFASTSTSASGISGTLRWQAPEIIHAPDGCSMRKTAETDVYAFGMTIYEVGSGYILAVCETDEKLILGPDHRASLQCKLD